MNLAELRALFSLIGSVLLIALIFLIPLYLAAIRRPKPQITHILWSLFWRAPLIWLLGQTLYPELNFFSAVVLVLLVLGPFELRTRLLEKPHGRFE